MRDQRLVTYFRRTRNFPKLYEALNSPPATARPWVGVGADWEAFNCVQCANRRPATMGLLGLGRSRGVEPSALVEQFSESVRPAVVATDRGNASASVSVVLATCTNGMKLLCT